MLIRQFDQIVKAKGNGRVIFGQIFNHFGGRRQLLKILDHRHLHNFSQ